MIDEMFDRAYVAGRADLNAGLAQLLAEFGQAARNAFTVLNRIEYQAPWLEKRRKTVRRA